MGQGCSAVGGRTGKCEGERGGRRGGRSDGREGRAVRDNTREGEGGRRTMCTYRISGNVEGKRRRGNAKSCLPLVGPIRVCHVIVEVRINIGTNSRRELGIVRVQRMRRGDRRRVRGSGGGGSGGDMLCG